MEQERKIDIMDFSDEDFSEDNIQGSDELLSDDFLRLPEDANVLVRIHAVQAWLTRRIKESELDIGNVALELQEVQMAATALRRREREQQSAQQLRIQQRFEGTQEQLRGFQQASSLLEETLSHVTSSERTLVEYYLALEELMQRPEDEATATPSSSWYTALSEVQHRVEHVGIPSEAD